MERRYDPNDFPYPLNEDMEAIYVAKEVSDAAPDDSAKFYALKKAIYETTLTMKSICIDGRLRPDLRDEMADYFWGFLL